MGSWGSWRRLGGGGDVTAGTGGGTPEPVPPYEAPISGTSGVVTGTTHAQGTSPNVVFKRSGTAFDTAYAVNAANGDVSWSSAETLNSSTDKILITG